MADKTNSSVGPRPFAGRAAPSGGQARPASTEATQESTENETYTKAEVEALLKQHKAETYQQTQSLLDQLDHRQAQRLKATMEPVNNTIAALEAAGVKVDPATADSVRSQARVNALAGPGGAEDDAEDQGRQTQANGRTSEANRGNGGQTLGNLIVQMMQERGVFVLDTDPEAKLINVQERDPQKLLSMAEKAISTKIARLAGVEVPAEPTETESVIGTEEKGPGPNPKGKGTKGTKILPEGEPLDYLQAGYDESPEYPHAA